MDNKVHDGELPHLVAPEDNIEELWVTLLDAANAYLKHDPDPCIMIGLSDKQTFLGLGTKAQFTMMCDGRSGAQIDRERAMLAAAPVAATQADQQAVPEGWKLAPPYSTSEMDSAGHDSLLASGNNAMQRDAEACYKAMFAVMPKPLAAAPVAAIEQPPTDAMLASWPQRICLQWNPGEREAYPGMSDDLTWCDHRIHRSDVEYVRADLADLRTQPPAA